MGRDDEATGTSRRQPGVAVERVLHGEGFDIRWQNRGSHVRALVENGTDTLEVSIAMWRMLDALCRERGVRNLLVVENLAGTPPPEQMGIVVGELVEAGLMAGVRVAFVDMKGHAQSNEYGQILALEHGLTAGVFAHERQALNWLLYSEA